MLTEDVKNKLEQPLTIQEIDASISLMCSDKSPGPDSFSVNFYKKFWDKLRIILFEVYSVGLKEGELHPTAYQGLFALLPKKQRDLLKIKKLETAHIIE